MKMKYLTTPLLLGGSLFLLSCGEKNHDKDKETVETAIEATEEAAETAAEKAADLATPAPVEENEEIPNVPLEEVALVTGFAQNLPSDIEGYLAILKGAQSYDGLRETEIGKFIEEISVAQGDDLDELDKTPEMEMARSVLGEEFFIAFGKSAGAQGAKVQELYKGVYRMYGAMMIKAIESEVTGDQDAMMGMMMSPLGMLGEPKDVITQFEAMKLPPVTIGMKVSDPDMREQIYGMVSGQLASALEFDDFPGFKELIFEKDGVQLTGVTLAGAPLAELMEAEGQGAVEFLGGEEVFDKLVKAVAAKNLHAAVGELGEYVIIYVGGDLEGFKLSKGVNDSLLSHKDNEFLKLYAKKDVRVLSFMDGGAYESISAATEGLASMAIGAKEALEESEAFGDTRDVQALLAKAAKVERELLGMPSYTSQGIIGFAEEGFKVEVHGGSSTPSLDFDQPHTFTSLADQEDILLYANTVVSPEYSAKVNEYLSTITETAYLASKKFNELDLDDPDYQEFKQGFDLFDQLASQDLSEIWSAFTGDFSVGTGKESAVIIDLKGTLPKIPDVPEVALEKGIAPRMAVILPVDDRAKVQNSWKRINTAVTNIIKNGHEVGMLPEEIVMQDVFKSQQAGLDTYNFQIPYTTQDALPTIGINDQFLIASSSQLLNGEIVSSLKKPQKVIRNGAYLKVNFTELHEFAQAWLNLVEENQDAFMEEDYQKEDFIENLPMLKKSLESMKELDSYTLHTRKLRGEVRSSHHFKMK